MSSDEIHGVRCFMHNFWLSKDKNYQQCFKILDDFQDIFQKSAGSRKSHHNYAGGYLDHLMEMLEIADDLYCTMSEQYLCKYRASPPFEFDDALLVIFLHDIEKPFKYERQKNQTEEEFTEIKRKLATKKGREQFRLDLISRYGIELTPAQQNALKYIEGENDDYVPGERTMNELASFCHACDILSARILWNDPKKQGEDSYE